MSSFLSLAHLQDRINRRTFLTRTASGIGLAALGRLLGDELRAAPAAVSQRSATGGLAGLPHFPPKARRVIYLFQSGAPSQLDLFDYKPKLSEYRGAELPDSIRMGQRL